MRKRFNQLERVLPENEWFAVFRLKHGVFAIYEPGHYQEVISYLITGSERSIMFDTGMGIGNIRNVTNRLTKTPVLVVNSHIHFDHIGDNHRFESVFVFDHPDAVARLQKGYSHAEITPHANPDMFTEGFPSGFELAKWQIDPCFPETTQDGDQFDLGNRIIEVLHTPGHSPDSTMLLDRENRILFTGDSWYPGPLYAHFDGSIYGRSDIGDYARSMRRAADLASDLDVVHAGHNFPGNDPVNLLRAAEALEQLAAGRAKPGRLIKDDLYRTSLPERDDNVEGYVVPEEIYEYQFEGFSIIAPKQ